MCSPLQFHVQCSALPISELQIFTLVSKIHGNELKQVVPPLAILRGELGGGRAFWYYKGIGICNLLWSAKYLSIIIIMSTLNTISYLNYTYLQLKFETLKKILENSDLRNIFYPITNPIFRPIAIITILSTYTLGYFLNHRKHTASHIKSPTHLLLKRVTRP